MTALLNFNAKNPLNMLPGSRTKGEVEIMNMKTIILCSSVIAFSGGFSAAAFATAPATRIEGFNRILKDEIVLSCVKGVEMKYGVHCTLPESPSKVVWRCLNGPQCAYTLGVDCPNSTGLGGWGLSINGFDTGSENDVRSIEIYRLR